MSEDGPRNINNIFLYDLYFIRLFIFHLKLHLFDFDITVLKLRHLSAGKGISIFIVFSINFLNFALFRKLRLNNERIRIFSIFLQEMRYGCWIFYIGARPKFPHHGVFFLRRKWEIYFLRYSERRGLLRRDFEFLSRTVLSQWHWKELI